LQPAVDPYNSGLHPIAMPVIKTEHAGAKNGGGYWGLRVVAKSVSRTKRRANDKNETQQQIAERPDVDEEDANAPLTTP